VKSWTAGKAAVRCPGRIALAPALLGAILLAGCTSPDEQAESSSGSPAPATASPPPDCPNPHGGACLGPLAAGTFTTRVFDPSITYTVPEGWENGEDLPGNFLLYRAVDDPHGNEPTTYVGIYADVYAASQACIEGSEPPEAPEPGVSLAAREWIDWVTGLPGVDSRAGVQQVTVGGLTGWSTDLVARGKQACSFDGNEGTPILIGSGRSQVHHMLGPGAGMGLIVLDRPGGGNIAIEISSMDEDLPWSEYRALVEPIIASLRFGAPSPASPPTA
jgi:hypothetical protein